LLAKRFPHHYYKYPYLFVFLWASQVLTCRILWARTQCHVMLLEKRGVLNTGNVRSQHTVDNLQRL
jgi:hypothetical protein